MAVSNEQSNIISSGSGSLNTSPFVEKSLSTPGKLGKVRNISSSAISSMKSAATNAASHPNLKFSKVGKVMDTLSGAPARSQRRPVTQEKFRGVFHRSDSLRERNLDSVEYAKTIGVVKNQQHPNAKNKHGIDFRQRLDLLLATEDNARSVGRKLYDRFQGDLSKIDTLHTLLEEKWGFPSQVFQQLSTHLRRATNQADDPAFIEVEPWAEAFLRWLQSLKALSGRTKVSRQCLIQSRAGSYLHETYLQGAKLGEGAFGEVHMMLHKALGVARVVKVVAKSQLGAAAATVESEVSLLKSLDHPHIVRIFETFETTEDLNIIMDYAEGGDLSAVVKEIGKNLHEWWGRASTMQIASALEFMHSRAVIHCDLKPANVMLLRAYNPEATEMPHCLLVDFGLAEIFREREMGEKTKVRGTPIYLAPEGFDGHLTQKSDMWALGVMVFELLTGRRPFKEHKSLFVLWSQISKTEPKFEELPSLASDVARALLAKDAKDRPTAKELRSYEWFHDEEGAQGTSSNCKPSGLGHLDYFHRSAMFCIASGLSMKDMPQLYGLFLELDKEKTGYLSVDELSMGLELLGIRADPKVLMTVMDMDQDGYLSYTEFLAGALRADNDLSDRLIRYAFDMFDLDGDGFISMHELKLMLSGDGPLADVLPDGKTVNRVMDELGEGAGRISYDQFRVYMGKNDEALSSNLHKPGRMSEMTNPMTMLIRDLGEKDEASNDSQEKPSLGSFHFWLSNLLEETHHGMTFSYLLTFLDGRLEATYVAQGIATTCRQMMLLSFLLVAYSVWSVTTSGFKWDPTIGDWSHVVLVVHNIGWMTLAITAGVVCICCFFRSGDELWQKDGKDDVVNDAKAIRFEHCLCAWGCAVPWISCFAANRFRVASLFGEDATDIFSSMNSDSDLVMAMAGTLTFFCTRTNIRFASACLMALNCFLAYCASTWMFGISTPGDCVTEANWVWPGLLLCCQLVLVLSGHRAVEFYHRLTFLSLYHSYLAIKEIQEGSEETVPILTLDLQQGLGKEESKLKRFKTAFDLVTRFCATRELASRPLRIALRSLADLLQEVRSDIVEADRWGACDVREALQVYGISGSARDAILTLFGEVHESKSIAKCQEWTAALDSDLPQPSSHLPCVTAVATSQCDPWGWDTLDGLDQALLSTSEELLLPLLQQDFGKDAAARGRTLVEMLLRSYSRSSHTAQARAALTMRAVHWYAQVLRLWDELVPIERAALLVAAACLHCEGGSSTFAIESLLAQVSTASHALETLDKSAIVTDDNVQQFRQHVCRCIMRAHPRYMLDDANKLRIQISKYGRLPASLVDRPVLMGLVVGMASYSFLALPAGLHEPWAYVCQEEASRTFSQWSKQDATEELDVAAWLKGLIEVLMLPICEVFSVIEGVDYQIHEVRKCLNANAKLWKANKLVVAQRRSSHAPESVLADDLRLASSNEVQQHCHPPELPELVLKNAPIQSATIDKQDPHEGQQISPLIGEQDASFSTSAAESGMQLPGQCD